MGDSRLLLPLLLLMSTCAVAQQGNDNAEEQNPTCLLATRFKNLKKYVYQYEAESKNGVSGTANLKNGPKVTCRVELEVPQTCSFVLRTSECALSEVSVIDAQGQPIYKPASGSDDFRVAMEMYPLKFVVEEATNVHLHPDQDEPVNILNIKRGIISALMVPVEEEDQNKYMATLHGLCRTDFAVNARKDIATDVTVTRDLSECDHFNPMHGHTSPLALVSEMFLPLSELVKSTQTCSYQFDNRKKHMMVASCVEKHIFLPFSHDNVYGITSEVAQNLKYLESLKTNNRNMAYDESNWKPLFMDSVEDKTPVQMKDSVLTTMRDLSSLSQRGQGQQRAGLFHKLVSEIRGLKNQTLAAAVPEMTQISGPLTWQALAQCGSRECTSAILQILRSQDGDAAAVGIDAAIYALGLMPKPCGCRVKDLLSMAQHRQSKGTMYGLSNSVRKFYQDQGKVTPEITEVSEFMSFLLAGDCSGDEDKTYLTLRVIGNMGGAMQAASPALTSTLLRCMRQPAASLAVQQAAIQAFRQMTINEEVTQTLMRVYQDDQSPVQKRVAAYLMMIRNPETVDLTQLLGSLVAEQNEQVKSFVSSHISNILRSQDMESQRMRERIMEALQDSEIPTAMAFSKFSRNYKLDPTIVSVEGNLLFDSTGYLPKELMLDTTLKAFGYSLDMLEVGVEGNGFEPALDALFGEKGFFPDTVSKAMYWAEGKVPSKVHEFLQNWMAPAKNERMRRQAPHISKDFIREISRNFNKLVKELSSKKAPEFMSYLRIMEAELGYIKSSEIEAMVRNAAMYSQVFLKLVPTEFLKSLVTRTDNELYAHYIFLDNEFSLPTAAGFPLKLSVSGIFAPGATGGLKIVPRTYELSLMPSMSVEFVTHMGIHIPDFVAGGIQMHTDIYHENGLEAKLSISNSQVKLSIPAPQGSAQIFSIGNRLLSISTSQTKIVPSMVEGRTEATECGAFFTGVKYCFVARYSNASSTDAAPYYPLTGETRFGLELQPTGEVSEYTATAGYELLREDSNHKVDVVKLVLKAEGTQPTEASAVIKYNRNKNTLTTDVQIPSNDVEVGLRLSVSDEGKGKKTRVIEMDVTNKNVPQFTAVGRFRFDMMKESMVQFQLTVPALETSATATATMKRSNGLMLQLESDVKVPETSSLQKVTFRLDENKVEVEMKSDMNSEIQNLIPDLDEYQGRLRQIVDDILEQKVAKTDMKLRHIVSKTIEAGNIWLDKMAAEIPYVETLKRRNIPDISLPSLPERLFLKFDSSFRYQFNKDSFTITIPLPLGGKSSKDLSLPPTVTIPEVNIPEIEMWIPKRVITVPFFTIPNNYELRVPLMGLALVTAKMTSNFYNWEGSIAGGNNTLDTPSYITQYKVKADSPIQILSYSAEGTAITAGPNKDAVTYSISNSFKHSLIDASFNVLQSLTSAQDKITAASLANFGASSPIGLQTSLTTSGQAVKGSRDITVQASIRGSAQVGSLHASSECAHSYTFDFERYAATAESVLKLDSTLLQANNRIKGSFTNGELSVSSSTNVDNNALKHLAELSFKDGHLTLKSDAQTEVIGTKLTNKAELKISRDAASVRVESQADDRTNQAYSVLSGSLNSRGLEMNSDGTIIFDISRGSHKATLTISRDRLETSGTTTLQSSPLTFENVFNGKIDGSGASLSTTSKGSIKQHNVELTVEGNVDGKEAYINSVYEGNLLDTSSRNRMNLNVNKQGLTLTNNLMGSLQKMKTEHTHSLTLSLWTLAFQSKTDNFICDSTSYKHDIKVNMKPFIASVNMNNNLKLLDVEVTNDALVKLEPCKVDLTGKLKGAFGEDQELSHTYEMTYAGLEGKLKLSTTGKFLGARMSHDADLEFAGLSSKLVSEAQFNSDTLRFDSNLRTLAMPFSLSVDALLNGDGEVNLYGKHSGQLYSKLLVKAEPLAMAYYHDSRASSSHGLQGKALIKTEIENKMEGVLTPNEQSALWMMKSKLNHYAYSQNFNAYNNADRIGVEMSGKVLNELEKAASDNDYDGCSISGLLKYDKNGNFHIIHLPLIESLPAVFDEFKSAMLTVLQSLQHFINSVDVNQLTSEFRARLDKLQQQLNNYLRDTDLENKVNEAKKKLMALTQEYIITLEDLEVSLENLNVAISQTLNDLATKIRDLVIIVKDQIKSGALSDALTWVSHELRGFEERHQISKTIIRAINAVENIIRKFDLQNLKDSSIAWLQELDAEYDIKGKILVVLSKLKDNFMNFDIMKLIQRLKDYTNSFEASKYLDHISFEIPTEDIAMVVDSMKDVIINWIEEYEIVEKINAVYSKVKELILKYELDKKIKLFMDRGVELVKQYNIQKTLQSVTDTVKAFDFQHTADKFMEHLDKAINQLKATNFKQVVDKLNEYIQNIVKEIKEFDYNQFVDSANQKISAMKEKMNVYLEKFEIPQKMEASRKFLREIQASVVNYLKELKETRIAVVFRMIQDVIDTAVLNDVKVKVQDYFEDMRQRISNMDIKKEIRFYLQRASESYKNMISYINDRINELIKEIRKIAEDQEIVNEMEKAFQDYVNALRTVEFETPSFTVPLTDLSVPAIQINLQRLQDINIPDQISIPEFVFLGKYTIPSVTIDCEAIKQIIITFIDSIRNLENPLPSPEDVFGDLRLTYLSDLPDLTFPVITLSEMKCPEFVIPKLNLENFQITMPPLPGISIPTIPSEVEIPAFGKLYGEFKIGCPHYKLKTEVTVQNSTSSPRSPQFTATFTSQAESPLDFLSYALDATARIEAPKMRSLVLSEAFKFNHKVFEIDHQGSVTLTATSPQAKAKTIAKVTTEMYTADIVNTINVFLQSGISASMNSSYNHNLNIPTPEILSQVTLTQKAVASVESGTMSFTADNTGSGKWSVFDFTDDGTHNSNLKVRIDVKSAKLTFSGETNSRALKMKQNMDAESVIFSSITLSGSAETVTPFIKSSVLQFNGKAEVADLKIQLIASHNTEFTGRVSGIVSNSVNFIAHPFEVLFDCKNKANSKIILPLKLTGKIDLKNDYTVVLNSLKQGISWTGLARFNQYKYSHSFKIENNEKDIGISAAMNGEANVDFLTVSLSFPDMNVPYFDMKTPKIKNFSLWEDLGLKKLLTTTQQTFDMTFKLQYQKNPEMHVIEFDLTPIYSVINENAKILNAKFEQGRNKAFTFLTDSYNKAKAQFEKYKVENSNMPPRTITVPGYTVPVLNIEVSPFTAELPAFSFILPNEISTPGFKVPLIGFSVPSYVLVLPSLELPVLHVPKTLRRLSLPKFTLPAAQNSIEIPAMGNITYDFSFKSAVITLNAKAGLYNQSDITAKFEASSTSVFDVLKAKLEGTTSLSKKKGLKVASALSLEHKNVQANHDSTVSLGRKNIEVSTENTAKVNLPILNTEVSHKLKGNIKNKPNVVSEMNVKYDFNLPKIDTAGKGNLEYNLILEGLTSDISLSTSTKGKIDGTMMQKGKLNGVFNNEANVYLNVNGLRSTMKTDVSSTAQYKTPKLDIELNMDMNKNLALEASLRRVYATLTFGTNNDASAASFRTTGKHSARAAFEFVPLNTLTASVEVDLSQPSSIGEASLVQKIDLMVTTEKQMFSWNGREQLASVAHACDLLLSNDEAEIRLELTKSVEGYLSFLKAIKLPIYQKSLWDVLKFGVTTREDEMQFLKGSYAVVYTKNKDGLYFALPSKVFENGVSFRIPEITFVVPNWIRDIPQNIREIDMRYEHLNFPEQVTVPPVTMPAFKVPFTTLLLPSYTIDLKNIEIPKIIKMPKFEINLPGLPKIEVPAVAFEYMKNKINSLAVRVPKYEIKISSFTLPKSFSVGRHTFSLDDITNKISNFELPSVTIPEQKIEIPEISLHLPAGVFIPYFGSLSTSAMVSSPIYNVTLTTKLETKGSALLASLKSVCTSTMTFLAYDLDATATTQCNNGALSMTGKGTLSHRDVRVDWLQTLKQSLRSKRQASQEASSQHALNVDITSRTFADASLRYASRADSISASISLPSSGFLGLLLQRRTQSQVLGKLYARYPAAPEKDVDIFAVRASLKNPEKLNLQTTWNVQVPYDMLSGLKDRVPAITSSMYKFANHYHNEHFGMDLNRASAKLKNSLSNCIEKAYQDIPKNLDMFQNEIEHIREKGKVMYKRTVENIPTVDLKKMYNDLSNTVRQLLRDYQKNIKLMLDAVMKFLSETRFQLPGFEEKLTGQELFNRASYSIAMVIDQAIQLISAITESYLDALINYVGSIEFTLPQTTYVVSGRAILEALKSYLRDIQNTIISMMRTLENMRLEEILEKVKNFLQQCIQKAEEIVVSLKTPKLDELSNHIDKVYTDVHNAQFTQNVGEQIEEVKKMVAGYKDQAKLKIQEAYAEVNMERLNTRLQVSIDMMQANLNTFFTKLVQFLQEASKNLQPYMRVGSKKVDIDIPLPFLWKSFSDWLTARS